MAEGGGLRIDRWANHYLVPAGHPDPAGLKHRLDGAARRELPGTLTRDLAPLLREDDERVCFVRRLELPVTLNAAWSAEQIGRVWSAAFARMLARVLAGRPDADVVVFRDRAEYLGRFLVDLAEGRAWGRWYYSRFDGLRMLPASGAIRTALSDDPAIGLHTLTQLTATELGSVLAALSDRDAARALDRLSGEPGGSLDAAFRAAVPAWRAARRTRQGARQALATLVLACRDHGGRAESALAEAARALAALDAALRDEPRGPQAVLAAIRSAAPAGDLPLAALRACPVDLLAEVEEEVAGRAVGLSTPAPEMPIAAAWGGIFHLLPHLDELGLDGVVAGWPALHGTAAPAVLRLLVLAACGGPALRVAIRDDPLARRLTGLDPWLTPADLAGWAASLPRTASDALLAALDERWRLDRPPPVPATRLALVSVRRRGAPVAVLLDLDAGVWRFVGRYRAGHVAGLVARTPVLAAAVAGLDGADDLFLCDDVFAADLAVAPGVPVMTPESRELAARCDADASLAEGVARLGQVSTDLAYLLPAGVATTPPLDLTVALAAQHVLRAFSRRLPGFARSSLLYLARNFLDVPATLIDAEERRLVRIGRPPLGLVLAVTGAHRGGYRLSWLDDRPFALFPEGDD